MEINVQCYSKSNQKTVMGLVLEIGTKYLKSCTAFDRVLFCTDSLMKSVLLYCGHCNELPQLGGLKQ